MESHKKAKLSPEEKAQNILDLPRDQAEKVLSILLKEHIAKIEDLQTKLAQAEDRWTTFREVLCEETELARTETNTRKRKLERFACYVDKVLTKTDDVVL